jgi:hypothetical protein
MGIATIMAIPLSNLGIQSFPLEEKNTLSGLKAKSLNNMGIETFSVDEVSPIQQGTPLDNSTKNQEIIQPSRDEYSGENPTAAFAKNSFAGAIGAAPDLGILAHNLVASEENQWPSVTDKISEAIDKATGGYTKDTGAISKNAARFLSSLFALGGVGKAIEVTGTAAKGASAASQVIGKGIEKTGSLIKNYLGITNPSAKNVTAGLAGGAAVGVSEEAQLPAYAEIPAVIGSFILGEKAGSKTANLLKSRLKPLYEKIPGLEQYVLKQNYEDIAKQINPDAISDLIKNSIVDKELGFLTEKTIAELPPEIQVKLKENPALLDEQEINTVIEKGMGEFNSQIKNLEKEYGIPLTTGEFTGSPKIIAKEDALANKPNIEQFDVATKNRRLKIVQRLEKIKNDLTKETPNAQKLGETISKEVEWVYKEAETLRSKNWIRRFGEASDESILPINQYIAKLKEFALLRPDTMGNEVAIKSAPKKLKDGLEYETSISPKRFNNILVGLNEEIARFPHKSFSQAQMSELKGALESDLDSAIQQAKTAEQASMIKQARLGYAEDSKILDEIDESVLFSKVNKETLEVPEKITKALEGMPASQLELTFNALSRSPNYQKVIPQVQRYYVEEAVKAATKGGADTFNPRIFLENLPNKEEFDIIFQDSNAYKEIKDISVLLKRMAKFQPIRGNSKTAQRLEDEMEGISKASKAASHAAKGNFGETLFNLLSYFKKGSNFDKITADILVSPEHRKNVLKKVGEKPKDPTFAAFTQASKPSSKKEEK